MLADCFAFQADIMSGDANMSAYRYAGTRQQSSSLKHSCWQDMVRYFVRGYNDAMSHDPNCRVIPRFVNLCLVEVVLSADRARAVYIQSPRHGVHTWPKVLV